MTWRLVFDQAINNISSASEISIAGLSSQNLIFYAYSESARWTWNLAFRLSVRTELEIENGFRIEAEFDYKTVLLQKYSLISLPLIPADEYSIVLDVPYWFSLISIRIWEDDERMLIKSFNNLAGASSKPNVGDVKMGLFLVSGDFFTDPDGWLWVVPNGKKLANSSSANDELHLTDGEATYNDPTLKGLFTHLWTLNAFTVSPSRGATAEEDWGNGKRLILPDWRGRSPMVEGQGQGLTARALGEVVGDEAIALTESQIPSHSHSTASAGAHTHTIAYQGRSGGGGWSYGPDAGTNLGQSNLQISSSGAHTHPLSATGGGGSHPNIHPVFVCSVLLATGEKNPL